MNDDGVLSFPEYKAVCVHFGWTMGGEQAKPPDQEPPVVSLGGYMHAVADAAVVRLTPTPLLCMDIIILSQFS